MKEQPDPALVNKAPNPKAFGTLISREQEYPHRTAFLYVRQEQDALDVVQDSVVKAYQSLQTLREPAHFRSWPAKIVINTAQDLLRKRKSESPWEEGWDLPAPESFSPEERMDVRQAPGMPQGTVSVYLRRVLPEKFRGPAVFCRLPAS